jgi:hypothetical protein
LETTSAAATWASFAVVSALQLTSRRFREEFIPAFQFLLTAALALGFISFIFIFLLIIEQEQFNSKKVGRSYRRSLS